MAEKPISAAPSDMNAKYEEAIRKKLDALMRANRYSQVQFAELLQERGLDVDQGRLSLYLSGRRRFPLSLIVHVCEIFHISLAELVDENFGGARQVSGVYSDDLVQLVPYLGSNFVVDPSDPHFSGYLQKYHVYLLPSQGDDTRIRTGYLSLQARNSVCEAILEINTNKLRDGKPYIREYRGRCIISSTMQAVYVLLTDPEKGELSVLNFRYLHLFQHPLDCAIACTMLNATGPEHPPTVQRMFLSRTEIRREDMDLLQPHLYLNSGVIRIQKEQLDQLRSEFEQYASPIDELTLTNQSQSVYFLDEDDILSTARRHLDKPEVHQFLSRLRSLSATDRLHKASRRADQLSHKLLRAMGYYHDYGN